MLWLFSTPIHLVPGSFVYVIQYRVGNHLRKPDDSSYSEISGHYIRN